MGIGTRLKEAREVKEITLEELQETTKIQKRYLQAIEEENFGVLPGTFYARAFIKEYAGAVGLDADELLAEFQEELPKSEEDETPQYTQIQRSRKNTSPAKSSAVFSVIPRIIVVLLVIGIIFAIWYFVKLNLNENSPENSSNNTGDNQVIREKNNDTEQTDENIAADNENDQMTKEEQQSESETETDDQANQTEEPETETTMELVDDQANGGEAAATFDLKNAGDEVTATLETTERTWLTVKSDDDESIYYDFFEPADSPLELDISGKDSVFFKIGHAPDVSIKINGAELEYPADPSQYVVQNITFNLNNKSE